MAPARYQRAGLLTIRHLICAMALAVSGCQTDMRVSDVEMLAGGETGRFRFPTRDVVGFGDLLTHQAEYNGSTIGTLSLPSDASRTKKAPVMVILHGSGGEWSGRGAAHARFLNEHGIGAFVVDTFVGRGLERSDRYMLRLSKANLPDQVCDAFAALDLVSSHPYVDPQRIGVMGYSMGGISSLMAAYDSVARHASFSNRRFALHVAFYAPCIVRVADIKTTGAPIVGLWGEKDESTPRHDCERLVNDLRRGGSFIEDHWYPGAAHGWNSSRKMSFVRGAPNFATCRFEIAKGGKAEELTSGTELATDEDVVSAAERCTTMGYTIGQHAPTDEASRSDLLMFIRTYLGGASS